MLTKSESKDAVGVSPKRVLAVTGGLAVLGAVAGSIVAIGLLIGLSFVLESSLLNFRSLLGSAGVGALSGAVFGPAVAWALLREVPLGLAVITTSVGAAIGAALALAIPVGGLAGILGMAAGGAVAAAVLVRWLKRRARNRATDE